MIEVHPGERTNAVMLSCCILNDCVKPYLCRVHTCVSCREQQYATCAAHLGPTCCIAAPSSEAAAHAFTTMVAQEASRCQATTARTQRAACQSLKVSSLWNLKNGTAFGCLVWKLHRIMRGVTQCMQTQGDTCVSGKRSAA